MVKEIKTSPRLLKRLDELAKLPMTQEELTTQKVSFIYGNLPESSTVTRDQIRSRIATLGGGAG